MFKLIVLSMDHRASSSLDAAIEAARSLPDAQQEALAVELSMRVTQLKDARLSPAATAEVKRRLAEPAVYATDAELHAFFARHGIGRD